MCDRVHLVDLAMAFDAGNAPVYMDRMIKVSVVWCLVNPNPRNRLSGRCTLAYRGEEWARRLDLVMTIHARLRSWDI